MLQALRMGMEHLQQEGSTLAREVWSEIGAARRGEQPSVQTEIDVLAMMSSQPQAVRSGQSGQANSS